MYSKLDTWHQANPGRMVKIGGCYTRRLDARPFDNAHYNSKYFASNEYFVIKKDINSAEEAMKIETGNIKHAKNVLKIGVNNNVKATLPGATYSKDETGAVYAVPVLAKYENQQSFFDDHVSHYEERKRAETDGTFVKYDPKTRKAQDPSQRKVSKKYKKQDPSQRKLVKDLRGTGTHKCEHCPKTYFGKQALKNHMRDKHQ